VLEKNLKLCDFYSVEFLSLNFLIAPLAPTLPPLGAGALRIPRNTCYQPLFFVFKVYSVIAIGDASAAGAEPPGDAPKSVRHADWISPEQ
jgi:hypothetical protein